MGEIKISKRAIFRVAMVFLLVHSEPCLCFNSFVFVVDAGNNNYLFTLSKADSPPYGIDFKPSGGQPTGRFTNGRTISDIVDQELGPNSFPPPYLAPNSQLGAILRGINYASGASGILDQTGSFFIGRVPLREQVKNFEESRNYMVNVMGENVTRELLRKAIFSLTIGSNDILNYVQPSIPFFGGNKISPIAFQDSMISNLCIHIKRLHELGGRKFHVVGIGPLGCIPYVRALKLLPSDQKCSIEVNELVTEYNKKLHNMLNGLNQELGPESIFVYANTYDIVLNIIFNYRQYDMGENNRPIPTIFVCFKGQNEDLTSVVCDDRSKFVFWDAFHPTDAANVIIAKELLDADITISFPTNLRHLYNYNFTS